VLSSDAPCGGISSDESVLTIFYKLTYTGGYKTLSFRSALFFCYGTCITPVIGGRAAERFGGKWTLLWSMVFFGLANTGLSFLVTKLAPDLWDDDDDDDAAEPPRFVDDLSHSSTRRMTESKLDYNHWTDKDESLWTVLCVFVLGMTHGLLLPSFMPLIANWFPSRERIFSLSFALSGLELGVMLLVRTGRHRASFSGKVTSSAPRRSAHRSR
jgi:MFS family permease